MSKEVEIPNLDDLIDRYLAGASIKQLSDESGIGRNVLTRRFGLHDVPLRGRSEAERLKWRSIKTDRSAVVRQCGAAWAARTGNRDPLSRKIARARTAYENLIGARIGAWEPELAAHLSSAGLDVRRQYPIGPYNVDLSLHPSRIAVEVFACKIAGQVSAKRKRLEYIFDQGWRVVLVWLPKRSAPDLSAVAEKLVSLAKLKRGKPAASGQYGVIDGQAEAVPGRRFDLPDWTRIAGL